VVLGEFSGRREVVRRKKSVAKDLMKEDHKAKCD